MNFREELPPLPPKKNIFTFIVELHETIVDYFEFKSFLKRTEEKRKIHAENWGIFKVGRKYFPARRTSYGSWEYIDNKLYAWSSTYMIHAECDTRYQSLRRIARYKQAEENNFKRS